MVRATPLLALVAVACARPTERVVAPSVPTPSAEPIEEPPAPADPAQDLARIESELLGRDLQLRFDVESSGAVQARLVGEVRTKGVWLSLLATGTFAGKPVELALSADGERVKGGNGTAKLDVAQPPELEDAIIVGLTRMGILHNLAVLTSARPPDHAEGGVREWVRVTDVVAEARVTPEGLTPDAQKRAPDAMSFKIVVAGSEAGEATLWWDRETALPVERHLVVRFPTGVMHVRVTYRAL
jgi:hypothetical protein